MRQSRNKKQVAAGVLLLKDTYRHVLEAGATSIAAKAVVLEQF